MLLCQKENKMHSYTCTFISVIVSSSVLIFTIHVHISSLIWTCIIGTSPLKLHHAGQLCLWTAVGYNSNHWQLEQYYYELIRKCIHEHWIQSATTSTISSHTVLYSLSLPPFLTHLSPSPSCSPSSLSLSLSSLS